MRHRLFLGLVLVLVLSLAAVAIAKVTVTRTGGTLKITGTAGPDKVKIENIPGVADPSKRFYAISDSDRVRRLPAGCFRFNRKEIHCPVELIDAFEIDLGAGEDELEIGEGVADEIEVEGDAGADDLEGGSAGDVLRGGAGGDRMRGGGGRDRLLGGGGRDRCNGGPGNDFQRSCEIGANY
jgi:Ca2+-binding RTX toxin-like protein